MSHSAYTNVSSPGVQRQQKSKDSYLLDKTLYKPLNVSISSSFNCIDILRKEIKAIDTAITSFLIENNLFTTKLLTDK